MSARRAASKLPHCSYRPSSVAPADPLDSDAAPPCADCQLPRKHVRHQLPPAPPEQHAMDARYEPEDQ